MALYLAGKVPALTLHLPANWRSVDWPGYEETSANNNPGKTANKLHRQFSKKLGSNTLASINNAFKRGAKCHVHNGFKLRNSAVANSEYLLAFTWNKGDVPKKGGTHDTWTKCSGRKVHISLPSLTTSSIDVSNHQTAAEERCPGVSKHQTSAQEPCPEVSKYQTAVGETCPDVSKHQTAADEPCPDVSKHQTVAEEPCFDVSKHQTSTKEPCSEISEHQTSTEETCPEVSKHQTAAEEPCPEVSEHQTVAEETCPDVSKHQTVAEEPCSDVSEHQTSTEETCSHQTVAEETCPEVSKHQTAAEEPCPEVSEHQSSAEETCPDVSKHQPNLEEKGECTDSAYSSGGSLESNESEDLNAHCVESQQVPTTATVTSEMEKQLDAQSQLNDPLQPPTIDISTNCNVFSYPATIPNVNYDNVSQLPTNPVDTSVDLSNENLHVQCSSSTDMVQSVLHNYYPDSYTSCKSASRTNKKMRPRDSETDFADSNVPPKKVKKSGTKISSFAQKALKTHSSTSNYKQKNKMKRHHKKCKII